MREKVQLCFSHSEEDGSQEITINESMEAENPKVTSQLLGVRKMGLRTECCSEGGLLLRRSSVPLVLPPLPLRDAQGDTDRRRGLMIHYVNDRSVLT